MNFDDGVQFDPGFVAHISAIIPNIEYVYGTLSRFRNFGQKKNQFKMFYPKIKALVDDYIAFYLGCILWADAIKTLDNKPVLGNFCCGGDYNEAEIVSEVDFVYSYLAQFKKDVKYYLGKDYEIDEKYLKILEAYKEFLTENKGFTELKTTDDIKLPVSVKLLTAESAKPVFEKIEEVVESGKLTELYGLFGDIL